MGGPESPPNSLSPALALFVGWLGRRKGYCRPPGLLVGCLRYRRLFALHGVVCTIEREAVTSSLLVVAKRVSNSTLRGNG